MATLEKAGTYTGTITFDSPFDGLNELATELNFEYVISTLSTSTAAIKPAKTHTYNNEAPTFNPADITVTGINRDLTTNDVTITPPTAKSGTFNLALTFSANYSPTAVTNVSFTITPATFASLISSLTPTAVSDEQTVVKAAIETVLNAIGLAKGTDYTIGAVPALVSGANAVLVPFTAGTSGAKVTVAGTETITVTVNPNLVNLEARIPNDTIISATYAGITGAINAILNAKGLTYTDYTIAGHNVTQATADGIVNVIVTANANSDDVIAGTSTRVKVKLIRTAVGAAIGTALSSLSPVAPSPTADFSGLKAGIESKLAAADYTVGEPGIATTGKTVSVEITAKPTSIWVTGDTIAVFNVTAIDLGTDVRWAASIVAARDTANLTALAAALKFTYGDYKLKAGSDFTVKVIANNGTQLTVNVKAAESSRFTGETTVPVYIEKYLIDLGGDEVAWTSGFILEKAVTPDALSALIKGYNVKDGTGTQPDLYLGTDYTVKFSDVKDGTITATVTAVTGSKYEGTKTLTIEVRPSAINIASSAVVWAENPSASSEAANADLINVIAATYNGVALTSPADYTVTNVARNTAGTKAILTVKGAGKFSGETTVEVTLFIKEGKDENSVLKPDDTKKNTVLELSGNKLPAGLAKLEEVFEIVLPSTITKIDANSFPDAARIGKGINITALATATTLKPLVIAKEAFAGQTLIVAPNTVLTLDSLGASAFEGAKFIIDGNDPTAVKPAFKLSPKVKSIPADAFANSTGMKLDFTENTSITSVNATAFANVKPSDIKGLFTTIAPDGEPVSGLFDVKLSNNKPSPLKTTDDNPAISTTAGGHELLKLTSVYANNRQEVHFEIINNALGGRLEDKKDYDVTVEAPDETVADLNSLINAGTYTLGLRFKGYEGLDAALADGRITFEIKQYPLGGTVSLLPADKVDAIKVDPVQFVAGNVPFLYTGKPFTPVPDEEFTVKDNFNSALVFGKDYELNIAEDGKTSDAYDLNVNAGRKTIKIKAVDGGNYTGEYTLPYSVGQRPLSDLNIEIANRYLNTKTGAAVTIVPNDISATLNGETVRLVNRTDYSFFGAGSTSDGVTLRTLGDHTITLKAKEGTNANFEGSYTASVTLVENNIHSAVVSTIATKNYTYTGKPVDVVADGSLKIRGDLKEGVDYKVVYELDNRTDVRNGITVSVQGLGIWGEKDQVGTFNIVPERFEKLSIEIPSYTLKYGEDQNDALESIRKTVTVSLNGVELPLKDRDDKDNFAITVGLSTNRNQATVVIKPATTNGNFTTGAATRTVNINPYTGNEAVTASAASVSYANGVLTLTNLDGKTVTIASPSGKIIARFVVSGDRVEKAIDLAQGIYILKADKTAAKFIVR
ncbi:hypothetical protein Barb6XT_01932 [Bacteroidales bacterium Barb6XT]|nr:hypothetical protein Barb6XT_01932 [Bacteroidales bacterium Barb6XT]